jgi:hypothetical protein
MLESNAVNWHTSYWRMVRHWHVGSEAYAGGDCLLTALNEGWTVSTQVTADEHWHAGTRCVKVYSFELTFGDATVTMPVITNPFVERLIAQSALRIFPQRKFAHTR